MLAAHLLGGEHLGLYPSQSYTLFSAGHQAGGAPKASPCDLRIPSFHPGIILSHLQLIPQARGFLLLYRIPVMAQVARE